jgi:hypothetical protein
MPYRVSNGLTTPIGPLLSTLLELLGDINAPQKWLVASLDKTIRLQLGS